MIVNETEIGTVIATGNVIVNVIEKEIEIGNAIENLYLEIDMGLIMTIVQEMNHVATVNELSMVEKISEIILLEKIVVVIFVSVILITICTHHQHHLIIVVAVPMSELHPCHLHHQQQIYPNEAGHFH